MSPSERGVWAPAVRQLGGRLPSCGLLSRGLLSRGLLSRGLLSRRLLSVSLVSVGLVSVGLLGCSARPGTRSVDNQVKAPGLTVDHAVAEGTGDPESVESLLEAAAPPPPKPSTSAPPDPEPLTLAEQWEYTVLHRGGAIQVEQVRRLVFPKPVVTDRRMGRFAIELWIGRELVERVRFDFPLLAAEEPESGSRKPLHERPSLAPGAEVRQVVRVPASPRATRAVLVDRATEQQRELPWPPDQPLPPVRSEPDEPDEPRAPGDAKPATKPAAKPAPAPKPASKPAS